MRRASAFSAWVVAAGVLLAARPAAADPIDWLPLPPPKPFDPYALPDAPAPPTLPDLTHRGIAAGLELTIASVKGNADASGARNAAYLERLEAEWAVAQRRWFVGIAHEAAVGSAVETGSRRFLVGNPEVWGRGVWASAAGLAFGAGLGVIPPLTHLPDDSTSADVERQVRVVRPWDWPYFASSTLTLRPAFDVRAIDGRVLLQVRQGIDWSIPTQGASPTLTSRTTVYAGYRVAEPIGLGIEAWEVYAISSDQVQDDRRAFYAVSPSVRLMTRMLQPAISAIVPVDKPLFGVVDSFWAVRLDFTLVLDPDAPPPR